MKPTYNLPHNITYKLIGSYYTGGFDGEGYNICNNCDRIISRVAIIEDSNNKKYFVGFDCAKTLTGITEDSINSELEQFKRGMSIRKSILDGIKKSSISHVEKIHSGNNIHISLYSDNPGRNNVHKTISDNDIAKTHILPQLTDLYSWYIRTTKVEEAFILELQSMIKVGMEVQKHSYHRVIAEIVEGEFNVVCTDLYLRDHPKSRTTKLRILGELMYEDNEINKLLKEKGILK